MIGKKYIFYQHPRAGPISMNLQYKMSNHGIIEIEKILVDPKRTW
jgi:hypothetical protein